MTLSARNGGIPEKWGKRGETPPGHYAPHFGQKSKRHGALWGRCRMDMKKGAIRLLDRGDRRGGRYGTRGRMTPRASEPAPGSAHQERGGAFSVAATATAVTTTAPPTSPPPTPPPPPLLRPPPYPPPPPPAPPPKPPLRGARGSMGRASLTTRSRPPKFWPCTPWIAACACASLPISTKPKPLERPVSRSIMTLALPPEPYWLKVCCRSSSRKE